MTFKRYRPWPYKHKYGARSTRCGQGHCHRSCGEAQLCNKLELLKKAGQIEDYLYEKSYDLKVNGRHICRHEPDFTVTKKDGTREVREFKGFPTPEWLLKKKLFEACYPDIPYIVETEASL